MRYCFVTQRKTAQRASDPAEGSAQGYASIMRGYMTVPCDLYFTMDAKITRFLDCALKLYDVPPEKRRAVTAAVLQMDLHAMAAGIIRRTVAQAEAGFEALTQPEQ